MKSLVNKNNDLLHKFFGIYLLAVLMLWIKTYITQTTQFDLGVEGFLQQFLLFINPIGSVNAISRIFIFI